MPRLLILCEFPTLLGGERSMLATLDGVMSAGFEVVVAAPPVGPLANELNKRCVRLFDWQTHSVVGERLSLQQLRADLARLIQQAKPDIVHANSLSTARISGSIVHQVGLQSIGHLRDILKLSKQVVLDLNAHTRLLAVSRATRDFHVSQGVDAAKCHVIYNGVDLEEFQPRPPTKYLHKELNLPQTARLVAVIGQLGLRKGTDVALAAAKEIARTIPDVHWLIIGERTSNKAESMEFESSLSAVAREPPLIDRVHFLGRRQDVAQLLNECELLVHTARQESLGRVLLESAASGLPAIATDVGGTKEIFPPEFDAAVLVQPDDHIAIANAAATLLKDASRRKQLGENARERAVTAFDIRIAAASLINHYRSVLK